MARRTYNRAKVVCLTGGPGAGKTAIVDTIRRQWHRRLIVVPEAASTLYGGGFTRARDKTESRWVQTAIYHVQNTAEAVARHRAGLSGGQVRALICDRGTLDGAAYWPGTSQSYFRHVHSSIPYELSRYDVVIHLETPSGIVNGYNHSNPLRVESVAEARRLDERLDNIWRLHPCRYKVTSRSSFVEKVEEVFDILRLELPGCFTK